MCSRKPSKNDYRRIKNLQVSIVRIFNTYGPGMQPDDGRVISNLIVQALQGENLTIYGNGEQTRSFSYIEDTLDGILKIIHHEESDVFNIGNDNEVTIKYLAEKIIELTNSNSKIVYHELPINDPKQRKPDLTKAKELLNYKPKTSLEDGLKLTIDWISANYK